MGLADNAIPRSWGWAHNEILLWSIVGVVVIASVGSNVVEALRPTVRGKQQRARIRAEAAGEPWPAGPLWPGDTLPTRGQRFAGRAQALTGLAWRLEDGQAVVLRGLAGAGKSLLALEYAHQMRASGRYRLVGWVQADSPATIARGLAALAPPLGLPADGAASEIASRVVAMLRSRRDWLVVFDNAQTPGDLMAVWPGGDGHVLITSRNRGWNGIAVPMDLGGFSRAESVKFLCERSRSYEPDAAAELAAELGDFPLALAQAAACIDKESMMIRDYLELYRDPAEASALRDAGLDTAEYPASVARTLLLHIRQLGREYPVAVKLLWLCVFLDPGDIDLELLSVGPAVTGEALASVLSSPRECAKAARALAASNLVTVRADGHLRVPPLVRAVAQDKLSGDQAAKWARRALNLTKAIVPPAPADHRSWPAYAAAAPHIRAVAGHASNDPHPALLRNLGTYFSASKQPEAARATFEDALAISKTANDGESCDSAKTLDNLAIAYWQLGRLDDARASNKRALDGFLATSGPDHPETARSFGNRGVIQLGTGDLEAARDSFKRALDIFLVAYGPRHPDIARTRDNLGIIQLGLGEFGDAEVSFEEALATFRAAYGPGHLDVANTLMNLSIAQRELGSLEDARTSIGQALAIFQAAYGPSHPVVAMALANLGVVQRRSRELKAAYTSIKRALTILLEAYGPDHHELIEHLINLGILRRRKVTGYLISRALASRTMRLAPEDQPFKPAA